MNTVMTLHDRRETAEPSVALAARAPVPGLIRPVARPQEVMQLQEEVRGMIAEILKEGRDYGVIPGCGDKPSMLKPGAERAQMAFGCYSRFRIVEKEVDHEREMPWLKRKKEWVNGRATGNWTEERGTALGLYRYVVECEIVHRESESVVGSCIGSCSTLESKYSDRPRETENTVLKMATKRAHVGAVLNAFGLSDQFTQDIEENPELYRRDDAGEAASSDPQAKCPVCKGAMWDNRANKRSDRAPDFKCKDKNCDGAYWPGQWPPANLDDLAAKVRQMAEDIRLLDGAAGIRAHQEAEAVIQHPDVSEESVKKIGGVLLARLKALQKAAESGAAKSPAPAVAEPEPEKAEPEYDPDELPF